MAYESFVKSIHRNMRTSGTFITISNDRKRIYFSYLIAKWIASNNVKAFEFLFDRENQRIAFSPASVNAYNIRFVCRSQAYVTAMAFVKHIGNPPPGRYAAEIDEENKLIVAEIMKAIMEAETFNHNLKEGV